MRPIKLFILLVALATFAAACGGDGDDTASTDDTGDATSDADATADTDEADEAAAEPAEPDCAPTSGTFESIDGAVTLTATDAIAGRILDGQAYSIYLADRALSEDELGIISVPEPGAGEVVVALAITTFNAEGPEDPVVAGEVVEYTSDFGVRTFVVTADLGDDILGNSTEASGTVTITSVGSSICGEVTYQDNEKTLTAVFAAPVKDV